MRLNGNGNGNRNGNGNGTAVAAEVVRGVIHGSAEAQASLAPGAYEALELAIDARLPFIGLRGFAPDPSLLLYVPLTVAVREQVAPLVLIDDTLTVASARPDPDLGQVARTFPRLGIAVVIAPADEIAEMLESLGSEPPERAYGAGVGGES